MKNHLVCHNKSNDAIPIFTVNKNPKIDCNFCLIIESQTLHLPLIVLGILVYPECFGALKTLAPKPRLQINRWFQTVSLFSDSFKYAISNHPFASLSQTPTIIRTAQACTLIINFPLLKFLNFFHYGAGLLFSFSLTYALFRTRIDLEIYGASEEAYVSFCRCCKTAQWLLECWLAASAGCNYTLCNGFLWPPASFSSPSHAYEEGNVFAITHHINAHR